jgi:hypothetical protein
MSPQRLLTNDRRQKVSDSPREHAHVEPLNLLLETVETERDNLCRAESLLGCLKIALEYGSQTPQDPYYADVAQIACELISKSINALDPINLPSPIRGKVKEEFFAAICAPAWTQTCDVKLVSLTSSGSSPRKRAPREHRRNYSKGLARDASSCEDRADHARLAFRALASVREHVRISNLTEIGNQTGDSFDSRSLTRCTELRSGCSVVPDFAIASGRALRASRKFLDQLWRERFGFASPIGRRPRRSDAECAQDSVRADPR